jgi:teichuronic acid biosynthesis glycosyltransferase TuaC
LWQLQVDSANPVSGLSESCGEVVTDEATTSTNHRALLRCIWFRIVHGTNLPPKNRQCTIFRPHANDASIVMKRIRALCISRNYPNSQFPQLGVWAKRLVMASGSWCDTKVIAPVPWFPRIGLTTYARYGSIPEHQLDETTEVFHPRMLLLPGTHFHSTEAMAYYHAIRRLVEQIRKAWAFDLIHAHFIYPDGVVAARLAKETGVPFVVTEHASWTPWLEGHPGVRRQAVMAATHAAKVIAVSRSLAKDISSFGVPADRIAVVPNIVDGSIFNVEGRVDNGDSRRILFVGIMRKVKGVDVLLRAMRLLLDAGWPASLTIIGESFYSSYARDYDELRRLSSQLELDESVSFAGAKTPEEVAAEMRNSSVVVLPSRRETFGVVLAESLACGTPVVATRCGGPEDIVDESVGELIPPDDPQALANAIMSVVGRRAEFRPDVLSRHSLRQFGAGVVTRQMETVYTNALA